MAGNIYMDYAAATPMNPEVAESMKPFTFDIFHNPSAAYRQANYAKKILNQLRSDTAEQFGVRARGVNFTSGVTEANNTLLKGLAYRYPKSHFLISAVEHDAVYEVVNQLEKLKIATFDLIPVDKQGRVETNQINKLIKDNTVCVSVIYINNETGVIQDLPAISKCVASLKKTRKSKRPLIFHSDAAQAPAYVNLQMSRLGLDAMSISAAKIYGPKQSGALIMSNFVEIEPIISGGGQEHGIRGGTESLAQISGLTYALKIVAKNRAKETKRLNGIREKFETQLHDRFGDKIRINSSKAKRSPHISSVSFGGLDGERAVLELDEKFDIQVATGAACSAADEKPSRALTAQGLSDNQARSTLRFSFGHQTDERDIKETISALTELVE